MQDLGPSLAGKRKRVLDPWDLCRGRDVFQHREELNVSLSIASFTHWAPNCSTFSRAREHPIPGVANPPRPLRSTREPHGIPSELARLPKAKRRKVEADTAMAEMAANECEKAHACGKGFGLEHLKNSIARELPSWKRLESLPGVFVTEYHACMFSPAKRRKSQVLIHNEPSLRDSLGKLCPDPRRCQLTGSPHLNWKPRVDSGRVVSFATGQEREYPKGFCSE